MTDDAPHAPPTPGRAAPVIYPPRVDVDHADYSSRLLALAEQLEDLAAQISSATSGPPEGQVIQVDIAQAGAEPMGPFNLAVGPARSVSFQPRPDLTIVLTDLGPIY